MEQRELGRTWLRVAVIGMGTWRTFNVRGLQEVAQRERIVAKAVAAG